MKNLKPNKLNKFIPWNATCPVECENYYIGEPIPLGPNKLNKLKQLWFGIFLFALLVVVLPPTVTWADASDILSRFQLYATVDETYDSNVDLTPVNERYDFITTLGVGIRFSTLPRAEATQEFRQPSAGEETAYGINLDFLPSYVIYAKDTSEDYLSLSGNLDTWYTWNQRLTFRVRDYLIRSDEIREEDFSATAIEGQTLISRTTRRTPYYRNVFEPSVEYRFGRENTVALNYRNNIYEIDSRTSEDSMENYINPRLTYWFNIRNGVSLDYGLTLGDFERSPDLTGHMGTGRYTYRFNPRTSVFGEYTYFLRDFDPPSIDYEIHRPSVGIEHAFSPTLTARVQAGYYWADPERGDTTGDIYFDVNVSQRTRNTTYTVSLQGGFTEDFFTADNQGFTKYYRAIGRVSHQLLERMNVGMFGSYEWIKDHIGRGATLLGRQKDNIWTIGGDAGYELFRWLTLSLRGSYSENHSNIDTADYTEYRGIFRITASF